ncbi:MAG: carbamoyltransferase HypF, partial [Oscillospiraceae bacterium]|nr:carbamoyltransferase HypF [Oscillospiraceae bacterium]
LLVMTSMNVSDQPVLCEIAEFPWQRLADACLTHDRAIVNRCDDSLLRVFRGKDSFLRRSRGYAPEPVAVSADCTGILACGAEQKGSFALSRGGNVFLSQHIGDLKDWETVQFYEQQIDRFEQRFGVAVKRLVCDLHPDYLSTEYARRRSREDALPLLQVQHHHAHMAACMAENGLEGDCIGLIWDGTGYGTDGTIWGAECLVGGYAGFARLGSIRPVKLPGGDKCAKEIGRIAHSLLWDAGLTGQSAHPQAGQLTQMLSADLNSPKSSGMGRLFDGVFALLTGRQTVTYEGQGAVLLEAMADEGETMPYDLTCYEEEGRLTLDTRSLIAAVVTELDAGVAPAVIAGRFMESLVSLAAAHAGYAREKTGLGRVVLSGGVFQNARLLPRVLEALTEAGFTTYYHTHVSANDQGIPLGQTLIAAKGGGIPCV